VRSYARSFTIERATLADDGLSSVPTWASDGSVSGVFLPASRSTLERAGLLGVRATHSALLPRGFDITPDATRLAAGGSTYLVRAVEDGGANLLTVLLEGP
jgi:hypothetical protein